MKELDRIQLLEARVNFLQKLGRNKSLSLAAKGLMLTIGDVIPFISNMEEIKKLCNSDEKEIYAALCELADKGYLYFTDIAMYLGHHSKCDDCKDRT